MSRPGPADTAADSHPAGLPEGRDSRRDDESGLDQFGVLLAVTVVNIVVLSLVDLRDGVEDPAAVMGLLVVTVSVGATVLLAYRASGAPRRIRRGAAVFVVAGVVFSLAVVALQSFTDVDMPVTDNSGTAPWAWLVMSAIAPVVVVQRLLRHRTINLQTLLAALSAYLLIAVAFSFVFQTVGGLEGQPFFGTEHPTTSFMYFSLVTIATVGYGGLEAVTPLGQLVSMCLAIVGQVYLVTVVAMIVGLLAQGRTQDG